MHKNMQLQKLQKEVGMLVMPWYSNKGGRDVNKYDRCPYLTHTPQLHKDIVMCEMCMYVGMPVVFVIIPTTWVRGIMTRVCFPYVFIQLAYNRCNLQHAV